MKFVHKDQLLDLVFGTFGITLLNLEYTKNTKVIAEADDLMILAKGKTQVEFENYANIDKKVATWVRDSKIIFNDLKSKLMILTRRKPILNGSLKFISTTKYYKKTIKYLGIIIDRRCNFDEHIEYIRGKCIKFIHALSKSVKINWGLRHDVLRIIYTRAILPILSYRPPVWIECLTRNNNAIKLKRVQRLINIKPQKYSVPRRTKILSIVTGIPPMLIELGNLDDFYHITRGNEQEGLYDAPKDY